MNRIDKKPYFEVIRESYFSAAHQLREYRGKCEKIHGHDWRVRVAVRSRDLDGSGMVLDFHDLDSLIRDAVKDLDRTLMNKNSYFSDKNPSAEELARHIGDRVHAALTLRNAGDSKDHVKCRVDRCEVWENDQSYAIYYPDAAS